MHLFCARLAGGRGGNIRVPFAAGARYFCILPRLISLKLWQKITRSHNREKNGRHRRHHSSRQGSRPPRRSRATDPGSGGATGATAPGSAAAGMTITGTTPSSRPIRRDRSDPREPLKRSRERTTTRRTNRIAGLHTAGTTTAAAAHPGRSLRNGRAIPIASKVPLTSSSRFTGSFRNIPSLFFDRRIVCGPDLRYTIITYK